MILNRLCYASGNSEPGRANPTKSVAVQRVDNYGAGFLRASAKAVFAEGTGSAGYILSGLFRTDRTIAPDLLERDQPDADLLVRVQLEADPRQPGDHGPEGTGPVLPVGHRGPRPPCGGVPRLIPGRPPT